jgi:hypothetical protein
MDSRCVWNLSTGSEIADELLQLDLRLVCVLAFKAQPTSSISESSAGYCRTVSSNRRETDILYNQMVEVTR